VGILSLGQAAVVTSGGYQRYFEQDGVTYIHIIDPATGYPVDNDLLSVTVVTDDGAKADALSTTLFVMGKEKALAFQQEQGDFELVLITTDNQVIVTAGLVDCFAERGEGYTYEYLS
jgi:thiamine biosynthesis lipoprotein